MRTFNFNLVLIFLLAISIVVMITGYVQLNNSVMWGQEKLSNYISEKMNGSMDTTQYNILFQSFADQLRWSGSILLILGGVLLNTCILSLLFKNCHHFREAINREKYAK